MYFASSLKNAADEYTVYCELDGEVYGFHDEELKMSDF